MLCCAIFLVLALFNFYRNLAIDNKVGKIIVNHCFKFLSSLINTLLEIEVSAVYLRISTTPEYARILIDVFLYKEVLNTLVLYSI